MPRPDLLLPVQRQMIGALGHDHLGQQARSRRALLDRLRRLGRRPHCAGASILLAHILDHRQLRRHVFVALAGFLADQPQILPAVGAVFLRLGQIVHNSFPLQVPRQRLPSTRPSPLGRSAGAGGAILIIPVGLLRLSRRFGLRLPLLPQGGEQGELVRRKPLAFAVALGVQQLAQQALDLRSLGELTIQLRHQVQHHLPQQLWIVGKMFGIDRHE